VTVVNIDLDDVGGTAEVAAHLHVPKARVSRWIERRDAVHCPAPVKELTGGNLYLLSEWRAWHALWTSTRGWAA
jgi:hypothetical protein